MIKVSVLYPRQDGAKFDMKYYLDTHIPLVKQRLGGALKTITVEQGLAGGAPQSPPPFAVMAQLAFDSVDAFQSAFGPHAAEIMGDIPNFTAIQPTMQISEVKLG